MGRSDSRKIDGGDFVEKFPLVQDADEVSTYETAKAVAGNGDTGDRLVLLLESVDFREDLHAVGICCGRSDDDGRTSSATRSAPQSMPSYVDESLFVCATNVCRRSPAGPGTAPSCPRSSV